MNKYNWNLNYLLKKRQELEEKVAIYESSLATYKALIASYDKRIKSSSYEYKDDLDGIENEMDINEFVEEILPDTNPKALEMLLYTKNLFQRYSWKYEPISYSPCYLNNKQLVDYTISLIEKVPNKGLVDDIKSFVIPTKNLLHIKHKDKLSTNYGGVTFIDFSTRKPYCLIARENNTNDIIALAHELFHMAIKNRANINNINGPNTIYDEIEGYMADFIMQNLLKEEGIQEKEIDFMDTEDLWKTGITAQDFFITNAILAYSDDNYKVRLGDLNQFLKEENFKFKITKKNIDAFFYDKFNEDLAYAFSYLAAVDLYELYKIDPEKAIYHLYCTNQFNGLSIEKELKSIDVTFYEDGYKNLENKCNKLLKKKTTKK